jgi:Xaa-Pro aminopeptidase
MSELDWHANRAALESLAQLDREPTDEGIDLVALRGYRLQRVRSQMAALGMDAVILSDPVNIRYATGARNMQVFSMRNAASRYLLLTQDRSFLYEFAGCRHLAAGLETIDEVRAARTASFVAAGPHTAAFERAWAHDMAEQITGLVGARATVGIERLNAGVAIELNASGVRVVDAQYAVEMARCVKSAEELKCISASLRATEVAVGTLREAIEPGMTENELWSLLHQSIIAQNGDYVETRLLSAGRRTNPWFQEASENTIGPNELVALDTDVVGCFGYYSDFSRTFHSGPEKPTQEQRTLYGVAYEQLQHNLSILRPHISFRDYARRAWDIPEKYYANRYYLSAHGCGMTGEYPYLYHEGDFPESGYDGEIVPGMTICVESYIGLEGGDEGVKLEEQVLVTPTGVEVLSRFPFEEELSR